MSSSVLPLTGLRKAAILLVVLGDDVASLIYKSLPEEVLRLITQEITELDYISPETASAVLEEYHRLTLTQEYLAQGGPAYASQLLIKAFGESRRKIAARPGDEGAGSRHAQSEYTAEGGSGATGEIHSGRAPADHRARAGASDRQGGIGGVRHCCRKKCAARPWCAWLRCSSFLRKWCRRYR